MLNPEFDIGSFLKDHWQRQPCVIRKALPGFTDPLDEHDLAGLAQEQDIDSRIVTCIDTQWHVHHGPFSEFDDVCQGLWSLMVQGVDKWLPEVHELASAFSFIPHWRFDDVMVSYAVPGAGVGPHVDQYDVFLIQGKGRRHWQVGKPANSATLLPHKDLCQVAAFDPFIDVELMPGDILYIPPGWPHCGTSVEASLTYSIGFRAPDVQDLLMPLQEAIQSIPALTRYADPGLTNNRKANGIVEANEIEKLESLFKTVLNTSQWQLQLMCFLSDQQLPVAPLQNTLSVTDTAALLREDKLLPVPGCRPLYTDTIKDRLFINGNAYNTSENTRNWLIAAFSNQTLPPMPSSEEQKIEIHQLVTTLTNEGLLIVN